MLSQGRDGFEEMTPIRVLVCTVGLVIALAPMAASAQDLSAEHLAAELANAPGLRSELQAAGAAQAATFSGARFQAGLRAAYDSCFA